jgi:hypothetical protein
MNYIGKLIDENRKKHEDANKAAIEGTNALMSAEDKYWANKRNNEKNAKDAAEEARVQRLQVTKQFLLEDPRGQELLNRFKHGQNKDLPDSFLAGQVSTNKFIQNEVQSFIAADAKKNPQLGSALEAKKDTTFKTPEGFSNVVGVGANPVMESMRSQLLETQRTNALLEQIVQAPAGTDFTKSSAPSRAAQLLK